MHRYSFLFKPATFVLDIVILNTSFLAGFWLKFNTFSSVFVSPYLYLFWIFNIAWLALLFFVKPFDQSRVSFNIPTLVFQYTKIVFLHAAVIALFWISVKGSNFSRAHLMYSYIFLWGLGVLARILGIIALRVYRANGKNNRTFAILGNGDLSKFVKSYHQFHPELGLVFDHSYSTDKASLEALKNNIKSKSVDYIYCCLPETSNGDINELVKLAETFPVEIKVLTDFRGFLAKSARLEYHDYIPVLSLGDKPYTDSKTETFKRTFDILFSFTALTLLIPFLIIFSILTAFTSKGPIFYTQERVGRWGKPFQIIKFRSMYTNAENGRPKLSQGQNDNRITPWGRFMRKTRIDELPQFINVLKGDMSLVGPRPERQFFIDEIVKVAPEYLKLLSVKPGITSLGQVHYGYASDISQMVQRMKFDLLYLKKYSFETDMYLLFSTAKVMIQGKGQ